VVGRDPFLRVHTGSWSDRGIDWANWSHLDLGLLLGSREEVDVCKVPSPCEESKYKSIGG
jgi:hypothetical protein